MATIDLQQITLDDALNDPAPLSFDPPQRPPATARITCRVCDRKATVPILSSGLLCPDCRADLDTTARHIAETLAAAEQRFVVAVEGWDADYAHADEQDQARYHVVCEARAAGAATFQAKYERALAKGDGLSALLRSKERCDAVADEVQRVRIWAACAMNEVEAAREP